MANRRTQNAARARLNAAFLQQGSASEDRAELRAAGLLDRSVRDRYFSRLVDDEFWSRMGRVRPEDPHPASAGDLVRERLERPLRGLFPEVAEPVLQHMATHALYASADTFALLHDVTESFPEFDLADLCLEAEGRPRVLAEPPLTDLPEGLLLWHPLHLDPFYLVVAPRFPEMEASGDPFADGVVRTGMRWLADLTTHQVGLPPSEQDILFNLETERRRLLDSLRRERYGNSQPDFDVAAAQLARLVERYPDPVERRRAHARRGVLDDADGWPDPHKVYQLVKDALAAPDERGHWQVLFDACLPESPLMIPPAPIVWDMPSPQREDFLKRVAEVDWASAGRGFDFSPISRALAGAVSKREGDELQNPSLCYSHLCDRTNETLLPGAENTIPFLVDLIQLGSPLAADFIALLSLLRRSELSLRSGLTPAEALEVHDRIVARVDAVLPLVLSFLDDPNDERRGSALNFVAGTTSQRAVLGPMLLERYRRSSGVARAELLIALGHLHAFDDTANELFHDALTTFPPGHRWVPAALLAMTGRPLFPEVADEVRRETFRCLNGEAVPGGVERVRRPWPSPRQMMADALKRIDVATAFPWLQFLVITLDGHDVGLQRQWLGAIARIAVGPRPPVDWRAWRLSRVQIDSLRWICRVPNPTSEILDWPQSFKDRILHSVGLPSVEETTAWLEAMPR